METYDSNISTFSAIDATIAAAASWLRTNVGRYGEPCSEFDEEMVELLTEFYVAESVSHIAENAKHGRFSASIAFVAESAEFDDPTALMAFPARNMIEFSFSKRFSSADRSWFVDDPALCQRIVADIADNIASALIDRGFAIESEALAGPRGSIRYEIRASWGDAIKDYTYMIDTPAQVEAIRHGISGRDIFISPLLRQTK